MPSPDDDAQMSTDLLDLLEREQKALEEAKQLAAKLDEQLERLQRDQDDWKPRKPR